jgi:hypothetical protein
MNKLDSQLQTLATAIDCPSQSNPHSVRHLIVLVPTDSDYTAATRRIWKLANTLGAQVQFLGLCKDAAQEPGLRRGLITMKSLLQDGKVFAGLKIEFGTNWVEVVRRNYQEGDTIVCFAEQRAGLFHRPLSQILVSDLKVPVYILSGLSPKESLGSNWVSQAAAWGGSIAVIAGAFLLQIRITSLPQDWAQTTLLILTVIVETWLIWMWNSLF